MQQTDDDNMGNIDLAEVIHYALSTFKGGMIHGITHCENVERNGLLMAGKNPEVNKRVVRLFAYLHDHQRDNDGTDKLHVTIATKCEKTIYNRIQEFIADIGNN